jgi:hypothetical protein
MPVTRIEASLTAAHLMNHIPGLRHRVEEALGGIIESAVEVARAHGVHVMGSPQDPMRLHIGNYVVWYYLDAMNCSAKVVYVEMVSGAGGRQPGRSAQQNAKPRDGSKVA